MIFLFFLLIFALITLGPGFIYLLVRIRDGTD